MDYSSECSVKSNHNRDTDRISDKTVELDVETIEFSTPSKEICFTESIRS
jgi:hypothetical protein